MQREKSTVNAYKISITYAITTFIFIFLLDLYLLSQKVSFSTIIDQELFKGILYVSIVSTLTYALLQKNIILRRDLERSLKASRHVLDSFLKFAKGIAFQVDLKNTMTFIFGDFELITSYKKEDLATGRIKWDQVVHPDDRKSFEENLQKLYTIPNCTIKEEYRIVKGDGQIRWVRGFSQNFTYNNKVVGYNRLIYDVTEEKTAQEKVNFQANIIENINEAILTVNENFIVEYANKAAEKMYGWKLDEMRGHYVFELLNSEPLSSDFKTIVREIKEKGVLEQDFIQTKRDGTKVYINMRISAIYDNRGNVTGYVTIHQDVTEKRLMAKALEEREKLFRTITENMYEIVGLVNFDGKIEYISPSIEKILGYNAKDLMGKKVLELDLIEKDDMEKLIYNFMKNEEKYPRLKVETRVKNVGGEYLWFEVTANTLETDGENKVVFSAREVSDRKRLEENVKEYMKNLESSEKKYRTIFENTGTAIAIIEEDTRISLINSEFEKMLECDIKDILGKSFVEFVSKDEIPRLLEYHYQMRKKIETPKSFEFKFYTKKGKLKYGFATVSILPETSMSLVSIIDITEMKEKEEQLKMYTQNLEKIVEEKTKELREKERMAALGEAATLIGHDLRNPLQAIKNNLYILDQKIKNAFSANELENVVNKIGAMYREVEYMNKIVSDLQDYAAPVRLAETQLDLNKVIDEVISQIKFPDNVRVSINVDKDIGKVRGDLYIIKRIIGNLVLNAIQAMPDGGTLTITAKILEKHLVLSVKDTGVGISEENMKKIFTPFFTTKSKGQGLGLAVCKRLTELLGGSITVESQVGQGTTFTIKFPLNV